MTSQPRPGSSPVTTTVPSTYSLSFYDQWDPCGCVYIKGVLSHYTTISHPLTIQWLLLRHPKRQTKDRRRSLANRQRKLIQVPVNRLLAVTRRVTSENVSDPLLVRSFLRYVYRLGKETYSIYIYKVLKQVILSVERKSDLQTCID